jgi:hypothetical protein
LGTGSTQIYTGTSAATALVSGLFALHIALQPQTNRIELVTQLLNNSTDYQKEGFSPEYGFGIAKAPIQNNLSSDFWFSDENKSVYQTGDTLVLRLHYRQLYERTGDLYFRINYPTKSFSQRQTLFKIWQNSDSVVKMPYNSPLASPYLFKSDFDLFLYGNSAALFGVSTLTDTLVEGAYELLGTLSLTNVTLQARKIIWIKTEK